VGRQGAVPGSKRLDIIKDVNAGEGRRRGGGEEGEEEEKVAVQ